MSLVRKQEIKSIRTLISLICYDYVHANMYPLCLMYVNSMLTTYVPKAYSYSALGEERREGNSAFISIEPTAQPSTQPQQKVARPGVNELRQGYS